MVKFRLQTLIDQLQYAVENGGGHTTITQEDINVLSGALEEIERLETQATGEKQ